MQQPAHTFRFGPGGEGGSMAEGCRRPAGLWRPEDDWFMAATAPPQIEAPPAPAPDAGCGLPFMGPTPPGTGG